MHPLNSPPPFPSSHPFTIFLRSSFNLYIFRSHLTFFSVFLSPSLLPFVRFVDLPHPPRIRPSFSHMNAACAFLFVSLPLRPSAARRKKLVSGTGTDTILWAPWSRRFSNTTRGNVWAFRSRISRSTTILIKRPTNLLNFANYIKNSKISLRIHKRQIVDSREDEDAFVCLLYRGNNSTVK